MLKFKKNSFTRSGLTIPVIIIAIFALILGTLLGIIRHNYIIHQEQSNDLLVNRYSKIIESNLEGNIDFLNLLAIELKENNLSESVFQDKVNGYLKNHPEFINITWVDSTFKIKSVSPLKGNSHIIGLNIELPMPKEASRLAKEQKHTIYTEPFEAIQGKSSFEAWVPVFIKNKFLGLFAAVYSSNDIINTWININDYPNTYFNLLDNNNEVVTEISNIKSGTDILSTQKSLISLNNGLKLQVESKMSTMFSPLIIFIILLLSILIFLITYFLWKLKNSQILLKKKERLLIDKNADLKIAKEKVEENEAKYKAIYENAPLSYQSLDNDGYIIDVNPTWLKTLGYTRDEVLGKWFGDFLHPNFVESFRINFRKFKKQGYINNVQYRIRNKKGDYIYISFEGCIGYNTDGRVKQTYCTFKDITSEVLAKKELIIAKEEAEQNEEKLNLMFKTSPIGICTVDIHGRFITTNQAYEQILGYSKEELEGLSFFDFTSQKDTSKNEKLFYNMFSLKTKNFSLEKRYIRKDGEEIIVFVNAFVISDAKNNVKYGTAFIEDITERKFAEQTISLSNKRYKSLFNYSPIPLWEEDITDVSSYLSELKKDGHEDLKIYFKNNPEEYVKCSKMIKVLDVNKTAMDLHMAKSKKQLIESLDKIFTEKSFSLFIEALISIIGGDKLFEAESEVKTLSGEIKDIHLTLKIDQSRSDRVIALLATLDITDRKNAENEVQNYQKHLEELVIERTKKLEEKNKELERLNDLFVDREFRIKELKDKIIKLESNI